MQDETAFLEALRENRRDETLRLVYADWLEERDALRATYLRVESELRQTWTYENPRRDLTTEMWRIRPQLDEQWLAQVRLCTTPPPPIRVEKYLPFLKGQKKPTYLLHPRRGTASRESSKIGGVFLWPKKEPWPTCLEHDNCPFVPALQLCKKDIPRITKFKGTNDLLQVLWCPHDHEPSYCVEPRIFWRRIQSVKDPVEEHPQPTSGESWYIPSPCVIIPERTQEYPQAWEFEQDTLDSIASNPDLLEAVERLPLKPEGNWGIASNGNDAYFNYLSTSQCTKVGGHPDWVQHPGIPNCNVCGSQMEHLLSFGSAEYDGGTWGRWLPIEERDTLTSAYEIRSSVQSAPDWTFGDMGQVYVSICRHCKDWPIRTWMQCS